MWDEKKIRIIDIAQELGLSTATVSNVLHGKHDRVSEQTFKRVQDALTERGYIPNMAATLLAQNDSRIIGVVVNDHVKYEGRVLEDPFVSSALNALSSEIERAGYFLMLKKSQNIEEIVPFASMWNLDGMVLMGFCADEYQRLRDRIRIPFVVYDGFFQNEGNICNLMLDDYDGGRQVGFYFRKNERSRVLCIADNRLCPDMDRYEGLCAGLGWKADFLEIPMRKKERMGFYQEKSSLLLSYDACFAVSDYYGAELMRFLLSIGGRVPEDIWVVGFDDAPVCEYVLPALSSVRQDVLLRAQKAVSYLQKMKEDKSYCATERIPVKLVLRESSGKA